MILSSHKKKKEEFCLAVLIYIAFVFLHRSISPANCIGWVHLLSGLLVYGVCSSLPNLWLLSLPPLPFFKLTQAGL